MRKITFIIVAVIAMNCLSFMNAKAQCIEKGKMLVDVYYGYPNLFTQAVKSSLDATISEDIKATGIGPIGGKFEYLMSDKIGIALNINYANSSVKGTGIGDDGVTVYDYKVSIPRLRVFPLLNFHFSTSDNLDPYFLFGAGYGNYTIKTTSNDPDFDEESVEISGLGNIAIRFGVGTRYFFNKNLGLNLEFGIGGGGLLQFGVTGKF